MKTLMAVVSVAALTALILIVGGCSSKGTTGAVSTQSPPTGVTAPPDSAEPAPRYTSSIQVPPKTDEATLASLAKITAEQAKAAALKKVLGTVVKTDLEDENGNLVYSVKIKTPTGKQEAKVDAGNGQVLLLEAADDKEVGEHGRDSVEHEGKDDED